MISKLLKYVSQNGLFTKKDKLLVTVSGGYDSICLLDILCKSGFQVSVAHCNFSLRGMESDLDQSFVESFCNQRDIVLFTKRFKTEEYAVENKISIEMAARDLRYSWFNEIVESNKLNYIAVAHNSKDVVETFFLNISRGTGLKGLTGIKPKNNIVVRPLLFASREDIERYCLENNLNPRTDSTNNKNDFSRNKLRNIIIPEFKNINSEIENTVLNNVTILKETYEIFKQKIDLERQRIITKVDDIVKINISQLKSLSPIKTYLFEFVKEFGFNYSQINDIEKILNSVSGKKIISGSNILIKDRDYLVISKNSESDSKSYIIDLDNTENLPIKMSFSLQKRFSDFKIIKRENICQLDYEKLKFPLELRTWREGDVFYPLGMKNKMKLKDFFINQKLSILDKKHIWILTTSDNQIVWIIGKRIDNRFKTTDLSQKILNINI